MVDVAANKTTTATFEGAPSVFASYSGEFETFGDVDWIKINLVAGGTYRFSQALRPLGRARRARIWRIVPSSSGRCAC